MRKGILSLVISLLICVLCTTASAEMELPKIPSPKQAEVYLQFPVVEKPAFPTVEAENDRIVISGLSAFGILPEEMREYDLILKYDEQGNCYCERKPKQSLNDQIILNMPYEKYKEIESGTPSVSCAFKIGTVEGTAHFMLDLNKPAVNQIQMSYTINKQFRSCILSANNYSIVYNGKNFSVKADYGYDGWLASAHVDIGEISYRYEKLSSMSYRYGITYIFVDDIAWNNGVWYYPRGGGSAEAPKGIDPENIPFKVIGDLPEDSQDLQDESESFKAPANYNAVYGKWPGGKLLPISPEAEKVAAEGDGYRLILRGIAAWGLTEEDQGVWTQNDEDWTRTGDAEEPDTLIIESQGNNMISFPLKGAAERQGTVTFYFYPDDDSVSVQLSFDNRSCIYSHSHWSDQQLYARYLTEEGAYVEALYNGEGELQEYSVYRDGYDYTYTYEPARGADTQHPVLMFYNLSNNGEYTRYYWREYWGWCIWDDSSNGWKDCNTPDGVERCAPLPLL